MLYGYAGKIARINLRERTVKIDEVTEEMARKWIGGRGFIAYYVWKEQKGVKPLTPEHNLYLMTGPLSGTETPGSGKFDIGHLSPLTGGYGDSNVGGKISKAMRDAGWDGLILEDISPEPVVIYIEDDKIEFVDASDLWGKGTFEVEEILKERYGQNAEVLVIGPAAENLAKFSMIHHDLGRQAGRTGVGTTMGFKKVKAIVVKGSGGKIQYARDEEFKKIAREAIVACTKSDNYQFWVKYGTTSVVQWSNENGAFPTRNFSTAYLENYERIDGRYMIDTYDVKHKGCYNCPSPCGKVMRFTYRGKEYVVEGPEYETLALMGGNLGINTDVADVAYLNWVTDNLGLDTISAGAVIGWAIEAFQKGIITPSMVDGRELKWNDVETVEYLLHQIAYRKGIGKILAEGVKFAADYFGKGHEFAMQVKGQEISGYESRWAPGMMLAYATADIGAHHNRAWAITYDISVGHKITPETADKVIELQHIRPMFDMLTTCRLQWVELGLDLNYYAKLLSAATGIDWTLEDMLKASERVWNLTRMIWFRHKPGFGRAWDYPPKRWMEEPIPTGPAKGAVIPKEEFDKLLDDYYKKRGWDENGRPTEEKLKELDILDFVNENM